MIASYHASTENVTLSAAELETCKPVSGKGGQVLRAFCPFHGSDHQRSLEVRRANGRFNCYACGAWGYTAEARQRWRDAQRFRAYPSPTSPLVRHQGTQAPTPAVIKPEPRREPEPARADLAARLAAYQAALPGSWGERYLNRRGISLELAQQVGIGYAAPGTWPNRDCKGGRVGVPHTTPDGRLVNLYGRAVGDNQDVPKALRHDHLPGGKGYFNAQALREGSGPVWVSEGPFDTLSLMMAGVERAVAIFGTDGWRWEWAQEVRELVLAFDADRAGERAWRKLACFGFLQGKEIAILSQDDYGGYTDANKAWIKQALNIDGSFPWVSQMGQALRETWEERSAIMEWDGGLSLDEAEQQAWECTHKSEPRRRSHHGAQQTPGFGDGTRDSSQTGMGHAEIMADVLVGYPIRASDHGDAKVSTACLSVIGRGSILAEELIQRPRS